MHDRAMTLLQVGINDFYIRYHTVQLLTVLLQVRSFAFNGIKTCKI